MYMSVITQPYCQLYITSTTCFGRYYFWSSSGWIQLSEKATQYTGLFKNDFRGHAQYTPDATPCDFFLWGYVKDQVYVPPLPACISELKVRIRTATETITAGMLQTDWNELDYRVDVCRTTKGAHIEHL